MHPAGAECGSRSDSRRSTAPNRTLRPTTDTESGHVESPTPRQRTQGSGSRQRRAMVRRLAALIGSLGCRAPPCSINCRRTLTSAASRSTSTHLSPQASPGAAPRNPTTRQSKPSHRPAGCSRGTGAGAWLSRRRPPAVAGPGRDSGQRGVSRMDGSALVRSRRRSALRDAEATVASAIETGQELVSMRRPCHHVRPGQPARDGVPCSAKQRLRVSGGRRPVDHGLGSGHEEYYGVDTFGDLGSAEHAVVDDCGKAVARRARR